MTIVTIAAATDNQAKRLKSRMDGTLLRRIGTGPSAPAGRRGADSVELVERQRVVAHDAGHLPFAEDVEDDVDVAAVEAPRRMGTRQVGAEHQRPRIRGVDALEGV